MQIFFLKRERQIFHSKLPLTSKQSKMGTLFKMRHYSFTQSFLWCPINLKQAHCFFQSYESIKSQKKTSAKFFTIHVKLTPWIYQQACHKVVNRHTSWHCSEKYNNATRQKHNTTDEICINKNSKNGNNSCVYYTLHMLGSCTCGADKFGHQAIKLQHFLVLAMTDAS